MIDKLKETWNGLTKRGKLLVVAVVVIIAVIAYGQF
tara:strand:+ start:1293 stop:1400 length:108 start_codon:yes stop_codon:yes gene_type:complete